MSNNILIANFENLSQLRQDDYLQRSVPIEITHLLSQYKNINVITTNNLEKEYGQKLKVSFLLKGSFLRSNNNLRFNFQLFDKEKATCLLSVKLEESADNIFQLIDTVAIRIVHYLELEFISNKNKPKIEAMAYDYYLKGLQNWDLWNSSNVKQAIEYFKKVIKLEPQFPMGHARLSHCCSLLAALETENSEENIQAAKNAAVTAIELDETLIEAHLSLSLIKLLNSIDILGAYYSLKRAFSINNNSIEAHSYYAFYLIAIGKYKKAIKTLEHVLEIDPLNFQMNSTYGFALSLNEEYDLAELQLKKTISMYPDSVPTYDALIWNYILSHKYDKAKELIERDGVPIFLSPATQIIVYYQLGLSNQLNEWQNRFDTMLKENGDSNYYREASIIYWALGETKKGLENFEKFYQQRIGFVRALSHPAWKRFRESDKFYLYKKRLKLLNPPLLSMEPISEKEDIIVINSSTAETITIPSQNLLFIESEGSYCKIVYLNGDNRVKEKVLRTSLSKIMKESFDLNLYRCHNSFIINRNFPYSIKGNRRNLKLSVEDYNYTILVSRTKASEIQNYLDLDHIPLR